MKIFTNKNVIQKVIITILIVLSFNFIVPNYSQADFGGVLMGPVIDLLSGIGDVVLSALQFFMYDGEISVAGAGSAATNTALTIINPYDSFLLMRSSGDFDSKLSEYEMSTSDSPDITIDSSQFDKGWLGWVPGSALDKDYGVPIIKYTPEAIFGNEVPALDVNFINPKIWGDTDKDNHSVTQDLHDTIASWYLALRNLALVILLSVLLYVGIRMVISSTASDKAKYKQMILDWLVAVCILFFLHYIMSFILSVTEVVTDGISSGSSIVVEVEDSDNGNFTMKTDLTGLCRLQVQYSNLGARMIYLIFYLALVIYTVMFTWTYIKRAITMAFLTLMAPLVAITYPIDKIGDGKAQAFNIWLREFIFNALLQPFHLIIYTIFMGAASDIAVKNPIYAILFLAFIIPAEKLLRKMFGFDKSSTAGAMSTAAGIFGGAAAFKAVSGLISKGSNAGKGVKGGGAGNIRTKKPIEQKTPSVTDAFGGDKGMIQANSGTPGSPSTNSLGNSSRNRNVNDNTIGAGSGYFTDSGIWVAGSPATNAQTQQNLIGNQPTPEQQAPQDIGIGQWARDYWNNSEMKQGLDNKVAAFKNNKYVRKVGAGVQNVRDMASRVQQGVGNTATRIRTKAGNLATGVSNGIENRLPGMQQALKNSAKGFVGKATPVLRGSLAVAGQVGRTAIKGAGAVTMAGVGTAVGLAAGIAGDDLEDVLKYGAAGAALGATGLPALGKGIANGVSSTASNIANTYNTAAYGSDQAAIMQQTKEWKKSDENEEAMVQAYMDMNEGRRPSKAEKEALMDSGVAFYNAGITENKDIQKSVKLEKEIKDRLNNDGMTEEDANDLARMQAIFVSKKASEYSKADLRDEKKVTSLRNDISKQLINGGMEKAQAEQQSSGIVNMIKKHKGVATD